MKKEKKIAYNSTVSFVLFSLILAASIIGMFMFMKLMGENTDYPTKDEDEVTTNEITDKDCIGDESSASYVAKLSDVLSDNEITEDYELNISYQNTNYYLKCSEYDETTKTCNKGSGILIYDNNVIPLYSSISREKDYALYGENYYIIVDNDYVILTYDNKTHIYTKDGKKNLTIENVITSYQTSDSKLNKVNTIPTLSDNELKYYICNSNTVIKRIYSLEKKNITTDEIIADGIC